MPDWNRTIAKDGSSELIVKKSRFICTVQRVASEEDAREPGRLRIAVRGGEQRARTLRHHARVGEHLDDRGDRFGDIGSV
jgi:hypothetical protein